MSSLATPNAAIRLPPTVPYYVKGLAIGIPIYLVLVHAWIWVLSAPVFLAGRTDFRQFYAAGFMVRNGHTAQLYDYGAQKKFQDELISREAVALPFVSPAFHALVFAPLSTLPYRAAYFVFLTVNVATLGLCFALLRPWTHNLQALYRWLPLAIFLGFLPIAVALIQGQDSILLTALLAGAFVSLAKRRNFVAGMLAGLGLFKFQLMIPIALLFLIWRRWLFFLGFLCSASVLASVSIWLAGVVQTKFYIESLIAIAGFGPATKGLAQYPVSLQMMANVHGFVFGSGAGYVPEPWLKALTILLSCAVLGWTAFRGFRINDAASLFLLSLPCSVLIAHHTYIHDLSVLLLPTIVLLNSFLLSEAQENKNEQVINRMAALMFVAPVVEPLFPNYFYLVAAPVLLLLLATGAAVSRKDCWKGQK